MAEVRFENVLMPVADFLDTSLNASVRCARLSVGMETIHRMSACLKGKAVVVLNIWDAGKHRSVDDENKERREFSGGGYGRFVTITRTLRGHYSGTSITSPFRCT